MTDSYLNRPAIDGPDCVALNPNMDEFDKARDWVLSKVSIEDYDESKIMLTRLEDMLEKSRKSDSDPKFKF